MHRLRNSMRALVVITVMVSLALALGGLAMIVGFFHAPRSLMNACSRIWSAAILFFAGVRLQLDGTERAAMAMPAFFIGNHQSDLDIPIMIYALRGRVRFLAKDSLFRIPLFGWVIKRYGFVPIDRENVRRTLGTLETMLAGIRANPISMTAFPEGTRSRDGRMLPFRRGTIRIVQQAGLPVVPFAIDGSIDVHPPDRLLALRPGTVKLTFCEPIPAERAAAMNQDALQTEVVESIALALGQPVPARTLAKLTEPVVNLSAAV